MLDRRTLGGSVNDFRSAAAGGLALLIVVAAAGPAAAQYDDDDYGEEGYDPPPPPDAMTAAAAAPPPRAATAGDDDVLVCDGGWRFPLYETRRDIGPARFARQADLQRHINFTDRAFAVCQEAAQRGFAATPGAWTWEYGTLRGSCSALISHAGHIDVIASQVFRVDDPQSCQCLTQQAEPNSSCEGLREQLVTLRRYDQLIAQRAELVLAQHVCISPERKTNAPLRSACGTLEQALAEQAEDEALTGQFTLAAPLPVVVESAISRIRTLTDGRYYGILENYIGVRRNVCDGLPIQPVEENACQARLFAKPALEEPAVCEGEGCPPVADQKRALTFMDYGQRATWSMCNQLALADLNASTCRRASLYIDENGRLHQNEPLATPARRRDATMCIDISDFDPFHPLRVSASLEATGSVPERLWPGETMRIGKMLGMGRTDQRGDGLPDREVSAEDVLRIHVHGKPRGVSLAEVLRINVAGFDPGTPGQADLRDACRVARAWVPVVDHELPIGSPDRQRVIPVEFGRGRVGEIGRIDEDDFLFLWVHDIEPSGSILVEYADGQFAGYSPPPLLGTSKSERGKTTFMGDDVLRPGTGVSQAGAGVDQPTVPRRARYAGSRVLRLGSPKGNYEYTITVCTGISSGPRSQAGNPQQDPRTAQWQRVCGPDKTIIMEDKIFVHADYHLGVRLHFGYTYFDLPDITTEAAGDMRRVTDVDDYTLDSDLALLLAVYPFGRDPYRFSYNPLSPTWWKNTALLVGFTVTKLDIWEDLYLGGSVPLAQGVNFDVMARFSYRETPPYLEVGTRFAPDQFDTDSVLAVGFHAGLSLDFDLFERAFVNMYNRLTGGTPSFVSSGPRASSFGGGSDGYWGD
jgi:hypothetical protein